MQVPSSTAGEGGNIPDEYDRLARGKFEIRQIVHFKSEIRNLKVN
jgi:hypothetical protein